MYQLQTTISLLKCLDIIIGEPGPIILNVNILYRSSSFNKEKINDGEVDKEITIGDILDTFNILTNNKDFETEMTSRTYYLGGFKFVEELGKINTVIIQWES